MMIGGFVLAAKLLPAATYAASCGGASCAKRHGARSLDGKIFIMPVMYPWRKP
jgi:hypothetical protein